LAESISTASEAAEVGAETEALDANLKRSTTALEQMFEERFQKERALDVLLNLADLAMG
jgi:hypothetical protein